MNTSIRHFLDMRDIPADTLAEMIDVAERLKQERREGISHRHLLAGKTLAMVFEKPSTRTRVSFEVGMQELGGHALFLGKNDIQLGHGESIGDTAKVLGRFVDAIMLRCHGHDTLNTLADAAGVPVINGLSDYNHPCQIMADMLTLKEHKGKNSDITVAWVGDGNNVANSWIVAAERFGFSLRLACPETLRPCAQTLEWAVSRGADVHLLTDAAAAVQNADVVVADTWVSMGQSGAEERKRLLEPYQVNDELMAKADKEAIFMHCLPAHRGEEVTDSVLDGAQSVVFDEAENRLHAQKALMLWCFGVKY